jgi:uncharacterized damage-inducible protein DinB
MNADNVINRYEYGGRLLALAIESLPDELARQRSLPGTWSIAELVAHLVDSDAVAIDRMKRVIAEENPILYAYDENAWTARLDSNNIPLEEAVALFAANRKWMARILRKCTEADWARVGQHTESGEKSLANLVAMYITHLDYHLRFLYGKRGTLGSFIPPRYSSQD